MDERVTVGLNIVRLRRAKGISQEELALAAKLTRGYMSGLERAKENPTLLTLRAIADVLGTTVRDLLADVPAEVEDGLRSGPHRRRASMHRVRRQARSSMPSGASD
jgi:transcriptional regulator with XRE-family HTH domain